MAEDLRVRRRRGDCHWSLARGDRTQQAVAALFAAREAVRQRSGWYRHKYGEIPELRAILHRGSVVAGECGDSKRQIVYRGETLNTVARLKSLAKSLGKDVVVSDLGKGLRLPPRCPTRRIWASTS